MKRASTWILLALGVGIFAICAAGVDWAGAWQTLQRLGWMTPLALLPYLLVYAVDTCGWRLAFAHPPALSLVRLARIRWAGESVSNMVPSAYVGGELVKVWLLRPLGVRSDVAAASAVISKTAQTLAQIGFIGFASLLFMRVGPDDGRLRWALWGVVGLGGAVILGFCWLQRRGLGRTLLAGAAVVRIPVRWLQRLRPGVERVDEAIETYYARHRGRFWLSGAWYFGGWLLDTVELYLFATWVGSPITWPQAVVVEALTGVAKGVGSFAPGSLGVQESGILLAGRWAGLPDSLSAAYAVFRRFRELLYAGLGWILLGLEAGAWPTPKQFRAWMAHAAAEPSAQSISTQTK